MVEQALVYAGTVTFAVTGALAAVRRRFDLVGVVILAMVTAVGGGSIRDLVTGIVPPTALTDERLLWIPVVTALVVSVVHRWLPTGHTLYVSDTISLALFAALGAERGIEAGFGFWGVVFTGAVSGVGGGLIRDVLAGQVPGILYRSGDLYASAAVVGAAITFAVHPVHPTGSLIAGAAVVASLRIGSRLIGLELPVPRTGTDRAR